MTHFSGRKKSLLKEKRKKEILVSKSFPQKRLSVQTVVVIYGLTLCCAEKIEVINHWNHYFMEKCNYEFVEVKGTTSGHKRRSLCEENLILTT